MECGSGGNCLTVITSYFWLRDLTNPLSALFEAVVYFISPYHVAIDLCSVGRGVLAMVAAASASAASAASASASSSFLPAPRGVFCQFSGQRLRRQRQRQRQRQQRQRQRQRMLSRQPTDRKLHRTITGQVNGSATPISTIRRMGVLSLSIYSLVLYSNRIALLTVETHFADAMTHLSTEC